MLSLHAGLDTRHLTKGPGLCRGRLFQNCYIIVTSLVYKLYPRNIDSSGILIMHGYMS